MYCKEKRPVREIAERLDVSIDAVTFAMRKNGIVRRSIKEALAVRFEQQKPSFTKNEIKSKELETLEAMGVMLYWAEGGKNRKKGCVDFTNSDPSMITLFMRYLRKVYTLDEKRLRGYVYCYSNQNPTALIAFWSTLTGIPVSQFTKPYVRTDFREDGRKMQYGLVHIRYSDKKLFLDILEQIEKYKDH